MVTKREYLLEGIPLTTYSLPDDKPKHLLYFFHGFQSDRTVGIMGRGEILAKKGFFVVALDAYLHGQRSIPSFNALTQAEKYKDFFNIVIRTAEDAKSLYEKYFKYDERIIPDKVYAYGVSMGASVAFYLATIFDTLKTFATIVGSPSIVDFYRYIGSVQGWDDTDPYVKRNLDYYEALDPLNHYERLRNKNIFMGCGDEDHVVPYRFAKQLKDRLNNENVVFKLYPTGHQSTAPMQEEAYQFLLKY